MDAYVSTRGGEPVPFSRALFDGLAPDGGLYVPNRIPSLADGPPAPGGLADHAAWGAERLLAGALPSVALDGVVRTALDFPAPLVEVEPDTHVLELFHGPTLAFKDVGARFMAHAVGAIAPAGARITVLVATSGDTGGAVAAAFHGMPGTRVVVLFPEAGVSERQRRQMSTLGGNVTAVAVAGTFDDCQRLAKASFADAGIREACGLTSANSINVARFLPQALYYVHAAARLGWGERDVTFVVPCGNLGNLCAGLLAHAAGMPAAGFVAATNANRGFLDWLAGGPLPGGASVATRSNAMDVALPSNLERIRWLYGDDRERLGGDVRARSVTDVETLACIQRVRARTGYLLDPHTAVAWAAMERDRADRPGVHVVLATAHPAKFPQVVEEATGETVPVPAALEARLAAAESVLRIAAREDALRAILLEGAGA